MAGTQKAHKALKGTKWPKLDLTFLDCGHISHGQTMAAGPNNAIPRLELFLVFVNGVFFMVYKMFSRLLKT